MAVEKESWAPFIEENIFQQNPHLQYCRREDRDALGGKVVHIPHAGAKPLVTKNRTVYPATPVRRIDLDIVYLLDHFSTDPSHITDLEEMEVSYSKFESVFGEHLSALTERAGTEAIYKWLVGFTSASASLGVNVAPVIRTTGAATSSHLPGATGNRAKFIGDNLLRARTLLARDGFKQDNYALLSPDMLQQLAQDPVLQSRDVALELNMRDGKIEKLYGFTIIERPLVAIYDNAVTPGVKAIGAVSAATDNDVVLCYNKDSVCAAIGDIGAYTDPKNPLYYGGLYSAAFRMGARKRRADAAGIVAIVQAAAV